MIKQICVLLILSISINLRASQYTNEGYLLIEPDLKSLKHLKRNAEITFDHRKKNSIEVYGPVGLGEYLETLNLTYFDLKNFIDEKNVNSYPTPEEINQKLIKLNQENPNITQLDQIGTSSQGRPIYAMKISDHARKDELEPEMKYIANMHGDEIVGRELMVLLIEHLTSQYHSDNEEIKSLVDQTEIYIIASMNPDGAYKRRRGNSDWIDLNRDFPDFTTRDNENSPDGREVETKSIMQWQLQRNFSLSANFHGGAEVVNYPWDTIGDRHPVHEHVVNISREYAQKVPGMRDSIEFPGGIVNGYDWYEVNGGMQDWSYHWHNDLQVTVELSNVKWPHYSKVQLYWNDNKDSLVNFIKQVHQGIGFQLDQNVKYVEIKNEKKSIGFYRVKNNEFYKVLPKGQYDFEFLDNQKKTISVMKSIKLNNSNKAKFLTL